MLTILSITLRTSQLEEMRHFYEILGFQFQKVSVDKGSEILRGQCQNLELNLLEVAGLPLNSSPVLMLSVGVSHVLQTCDQLRRHPSIHFLLDPMDFAQGIRSIVLDPDGNSVEITQRV